MTGFGAIELSHRAAANRVSTIAPLPSLSRASQWVSVTGKADLPRDRPWFGCDPFRGCGGRLARYAVRRTAAPVLWTSRLRSEASGKIL